MSKDNLHDSLPKDEKYWIEYAVTYVEQAALRASRITSIPAEKVYKAVIDYFDELLNGDEGDAG